MENKIDKNQEDVAWIDVYNLNEYAMTQATQDMLKLVRDPMMERL